jgi:hypothetical protein
MTILKPKRTRRLRQKLHGARPQKVVPSSAAGLASPHGPAAARGPDRLLGRKSADQVPGQAEAER